MGIIRRLFKKTRYPVFDSPQYDWEKNRLIVDALEADGILEGGLLFDFSHYSHHLVGGVIVPFTTVDSQWANTEQFIGWFQKFFLRGKHEKERVLSEIECSLEKLLQDYANKLSSFPDIADNRRRELIKLWEDRTKVLIWNVFCKGFRSASNGNYLDSRDIIKRSFWAISRRKEDILYPQNSFDTDNVLLYNLWGEEYSRLKADLVRNLVGLSSAQRALLYNDDNKEAFNLFFCCKYEAAICESGRPQDYYLSAILDTMVFLESLFNDFIKRLRRAGIYDEKPTKMAVIQWQDVTISEINRIAFIDEVSTVLLSPSIELVDDFRDSLVSKKDYDRICRLRNFADKCNASICGLVGDYLKMIDEGHLVKRWSEKLRVMGINYRGLYSDMMKEKIIDPSFEFVAFEDAFRSADFAPMMESARFMDGVEPEPGRPGLVQLLVRVVGECVGDDWYYAAAESIYPKYNGKDAKFAVEKLKPTKFVKKYAPKIIEGRIPGYKY